MSSQILSSHPPVKIVTESSSSIVVDVAALEEKRLEKELKDLTHVIESGEQYCYFLTQDLLRHTLQCIEDNFYDEKSVPYAVNAVMAQMNHMLDMLFVNRDTGETRDDPCWSIEEEPERIPTDSWARSSVPIIVKKRLEKQSSLLQGKMEHGRREKRPSTMNVLSSTSSPIKVNDKTKNLSGTLGNTSGVQVSPSRTTSNKLSIISRSSSSLRSSLKPKHSNGNTLSKTIPSGRVSKASTDVSSTSSGLTNGKKVSDTNQAKLILEKQWETLKRREDEEEKRKLEKALSQVRGKDYTYTKNGDILLIKKVDPNRLPAIHVKMKYAVTGTTGSGDDSPGEDEQLHKKMTRSTSKGSIILPSKRKLVKQEEKQMLKLKDMMEHITSVTPAQPMIDRLKPMKGVVIKTPNKSKQS